MNGGEGHKLAKKKKPKPPTEVRQQNIQVHLDSLKELKNCCLCSILYMIVQDRNISSGVSGLFIQLVSPAHGTQEPIALFHYCRKNHHFSALRNQSRTKA